MKARSSSKRWYAQKASSLFLSFCDLETVYILAYVGSGPKLGRQLGALLDTVAEQRYRRKSSPLVGIILTAFGEALMQAMDKEDRRHWEQKLWMSSLSLPVSPCYRAFRVILCPRDRGWYRCTVLYAFNLCQLWPFKQYWKGYFFFLRWFRFKLRWLNFNKVWFVEGWFFNVWFF